MQKNIHLTTFHPPPPLHTIFIFFPVVCNNYYPKPMLLLNRPPLITRLGAQITAQPLLFLLSLSYLLFQPVSPTTPHHPSPLPDSSS